MPRAPASDDVRVDPARMDLETFRAAFQRLRDAHEASTDNPASFELNGCVRCQACQFCTECTDCYRCTYCSACTACSACTRCAGCEDCHGCAYCVDCRACTGSKYLLACEGCSDCTYCFGCVGLARKDFHILNEPYDRQRYFELVERLQAELGIPSP